ncbi:MAG: beta-ketoacyl-[acyl-carrier-protein] synthase family protein [Nanoarchaeota archaeon]|nr:beta-ketoacyl-[acyl-carrier-protein] synthase family protein [Nanoarchaeota archaeon]
MNNSKRRIVVTGIGAICPLGRNVDEIHEKILQGESSVRDITTDYPWTKNFDVKIGSVYGPNYFKYSRRTSRFTYLAQNVTEQAIKDSGLAELLSCPEESTDDVKRRTEEIRRRTGILLGVGLGGLIEIEKQMQILVSPRNNERFNKMFMLSVIPDAAPGSIANLYHLHADSAAIGTACASASSAMMYGAMHIREDNADIMICGGTVEAITELTYRGFVGIKALSTKRNHEPKKASRPFDKDRDGFVLGEGSGVLVLEELEHAQNRNAKIYAELVGYGCSSDGTHFTEPNMDYQIMAMEMALKKSGLSPEQIDFVNCHGTSTLHDSTESYAIRKVFGLHADRLVCNSYKGHIGHTTTASGGIESALLIKAMQQSIIPPTLNLENPDIEGGCDLDYNAFIPGELRRKFINYAMKNSFGFYGHNIVLIFRKWI